MWRRIGRRRGAQRRTEEQVGSGRGEAKELRRKRGMRCLSSARRETQAHRISVASRPSHRCRRLLLSSRLLRLPTPFRRAIRSIRWPQRQGAPAKLRGRGDSWADAQLNRARGRASATRREEKAGVPRTHWRERLAGRAWFCAFSALEPRDLRRRPNPPSIMLGPEHRFRPPRPPPVHTRIL